MRHRVFDSSYQSEGCTLVAVISHSALRRDQVILGSHDWPHTRLSAYGCSICFSHFLDSDFAVACLRISSFVRPVELHRHIKSNCCGSWGVGVPLSSDPKRRLSSDRQTSARLEIWNARRFRSIYNVLHKVNEFNRLS